MVDCVGEIITASKISVQDGVGRGCVVVGGCQYGELTAVMMVATQESFTHHSGGQH